MNDFRKLRFLGHALDCATLQDFAFEAQETIGDDWTVVTAYRNGSPVASGDGRSWEEALDHAEENFRRSTDAIFEILRMQYDDDQDDDQ